MAFKTVSEIARAVDIEVMINVQDALQVVLEEYDEDFAATVDYVLQKNKELYARLR